MGAYLHNPLKNPVADAKAFGKFLTSQGAQVVCAYDCDIKNLKRKTNEYFDLLQPGDAAFLFYAGHAATFKNTLRLLAISKSKKPDFETEALSAQTLLSRFLNTHVDSTHSLTQSINQLTN